MKYFTLIILILLSGCNTIPTTQEPKEETGNQTQETTQELNAAEKETLLYTRQEEKLARDVYQYLYDRYEHRVFGNILQAEQKHIQKTQELLQTFGLDDPVTDDTPGVFNDPTLQELYTLFTHQGDQNLQEAFAVGITIEEMDIQDLEQAIEETNNTRLINTYTQLLQGSYNHLAAFQKQFNNN